MMTRETKIGLVVTCSFLCLVGVVLAGKMRNSARPTASTEEEMKLDDPVPAGPQGSPRQRGSNSRSSGQEIVFAGDKHSASAPAMPQWGDPPNTYPGAGSGSTSHPALVIPTGSGDVSQHHTGGGSTLPEGSGPPTFVIDPDISSKGSASAPPPIVVVPPGAGSGSSTTTYPGWDPPPPPPPSTGSGSTEVVVLPSDPPRLKGSGSSDIAPPPPPPSTGSGSAEVVVWPPAPPRIKGSGSSDIAPPPPPPFILPADKSSASDAGGTPTRTGNGSGSGSPVIADLTQLPLPQNPTDPVTPKIVPTPADTVKGSGSSSSGITEIGMERPVPTTRPVGYRPSTPQVRVYDEVRYMCAPTDTLQSISQKFYSDPRYADALLQHNRIHSLASPALKKNPPGLGGGVGGVVFAFVLCFFFVSVL